MSWYGPGYGGEMNRAHFDGRELYPLLQVLFTLNKPFLTTVAASDPYKPVHYFAIISLPQILSGLREQ
jgi:hypothetical protein